MKKKVDFLLEKKYNDICEEIIVYIIYIVLHFFG